MTMREWTIKSGEMKTLSRSELLLFSLRCGIRVEPWLWQDIPSTWNDSLELVVSLAWGEPIDLKSAQGYMRTLLDSALVSREGDLSADETLRRCRSYAVSTLASALENLSKPGRSELVKGVINTSKLAASAFTFYANSSHSEASVDDVAMTVWTAIRSDIAHLASSESSFVSMPATLVVRRLRDLAPLWPGTPPRWAVEPAKLLAAARDGT